MKLEDKFMSVKDAAEANDNTRQFVRFKTDSRNFGIAISQVLEIMPPVEVSRVPNAPPYITGVMNLRGSIVPVIDLRLRFGIAPAGGAPERRIIILDIEGAAAGILVDEVLEVVRIPAPAIAGPPEVPVAAGDRFAVGVAIYENGSLTLLDGTTLLDAEKSAPT